MYVSVQNKTATSRRRRNSYESLTHTLQQNLVLRTKLVYLSGAFGFM